MIPVELTAGEQEQVRQEARRRFTLHAGNNTTQTMGRTERSLDSEVDDLGAEPAVARALGLTWEPRRTIEEDRAHGDLGDGVEVRHTRWPGGRLPLKDRDRNVVLFLVTGTFPSYIVRGWLPVEDARRVAKWLELQPGRPAWWVDQKDIWDIC